MSLLDHTPSPNPTILRPDPKRWGARFVDAKWDAHRAAVLDHAKRAGHPSVYDYEAEAEVEMLVLLALPLSKALKLRTDCETSPHAWKQDIGADLRRQMTDRTIIDTDDTPANGIPRPGGVA